MEGTAGSSPERKEAALNYWLQMATVIRAVAGELEGVRTMEWLRGIAATADTMLSQKGGQIGNVVREVGGTLLTTHMDGDRIRTYFGRRLKVESTGALEQIAWERVPAEVGTGGIWGVSWRTGTTGAPSNIEEKCLERRQRTRPWTGPSCSQQRKHLKWKGCGFCQLGW